MATKKPKPRTPKSSTSSNPAPATAARSREEVDRELAELLTRLGGERLTDFIARIAPDEPVPRHLVPLVRLLERARHERIRICVSMPPRHGKSITLLRAIAWWLASAPADTIAYYGYNSEFAEGKSRIARGLAIQAGVKLAGDANKLSEWRTSAGGGVLAGGAGGGLTGQGVQGLMIVDDPFKNREEADSALTRERVWQWFNEVAYTRLEGASVLVVGTRWHADDLIGRLEAAGGWEILNLPAIAEEDDPIGRAPGEALWPDRFPIEELESTKSQIGAWSFAALYEGRPRPRGAAVFGDPARFDLQTWKPERARIIIGADPAASEKTSADFSVACVLALEGSGDRATARVLDLYRGQVTIPKFAAELRRLSQKWWGAPVACEAVGGFRAVPQILRQVDPLLRLVEVKTSGDKFQRAQAVAAAWNDARVLVPTSAPWVEKFLEEVCAFTGVRDKHDDIPDALAHAWNALAGAAAGAVHLERGPFAVAKQRGPTDSFGRPLGAPR